MTIIADFSIRRSCRRQGYLKRLGQSSWIERAQLTNSAAWGSIGVRVAESPTGTTCETIPRPAKACRLNAGGSAVSAGS